MTGGCNYGYMGREIGCEACEVLTVASPHHENFDDDDNDGLIKFGQPLFRWSTPNDLQKRGGGWVVTTTRRKPNKGFGFKANGSSAGERSATPAPREDFVRTDSVVTCVARAYCGGGMHIGSATLHLQNCRDEQVEGAYFWEPSDVSGKAATCTCSIAYGGAEIEVEDFQVLELLDQAELTKAEMKRPLLPQCIWNLFQKDFPNENKDCTLQSKKGLRGYLEIIEDKSKSSCEKPSGDFCFSIGTSFISHDQALYNLEREIGAIPGSKSQGGDESMSTVNRIKEEGMEAWNEMLGRIKVTSKSKSDKGRPHTPILPSSFQRWFLLACLPIQPGPELSP